ncbi:MAG: hypothetical protein PW734_06865 [Verrucomicrobium sp.]|nr:hypothetical protein [Verrucomicrobium sp.]
MAEKSSPATVPVTSLAKLFELTEIRVQQLAKEGIVRKAKRGEYELYESIKGYIRYLRRLAAGKSGEGEGGNGYDTQRTRLYKARADTQEIIAARMSGTVHDAEVVAAVMNDMVARSRAKLLSIPTVCAPKVADISDPNQILDILKDAVHEALEELSDYPAEEVVARQLQQPLPVESDDVGDPDDEITEPGAPKPSVP